MTLMTDTELTFMNLKEQVKNNYSWLVEQNA